MINDQLKFASIEVFMKSFHACHSSQCLFVQTPKGEASQAKSKGSSLLYWISTLFDINRPFTALKAVFSHFPQTQGALASSSLCNGSATEAFMGQKNTIKVQEPQESLKLSFVGWNRCILDSLNFCSSRVETLSIYQIAQKLNFGNSNSALF